MTELEKNFLKAQRIFEGLKQAYDIFLSLPFLWRSSLDFSIL